MTACYGIQTIMRDVRVQIEEVLAEADRIASPLDSATFHRRPANGGWCVAECLDHITLSTLTLCSAIDDAMPDAKERGLTGGGPAGAGLRGRVILWVMEPPVRLAKAKAPPGMMPRMDGRVVLDEFRAAHQDLLMRRLPEYLKLDPNRVRVKSPLGSGLRLGVILQVIPAHARRHLWQAAKIL